MAVNLGGVVNGVRAFLPHILILTHEGDDGTDVETSIISKCKK